MTDGAFFSQEVDLLDTEDGVAALTLAKLRQSSTAMRGSAEDDDEGGSGGVYGRTSSRRPTALGEAPTNDPDAALAVRKLSALHAYRSSHIALVDEENTPAVPTPPVPLGAVALAPSARHIDARGLVIGEGDAIEAQHAAAEEAADRAATDGAAADGAAADGAAGAPSATRTSAFLAPLPPDAQLGYTAVSASTPEQSALVDASRAATMPSRVHLSEVRGRGMRHTRQSSVRAGARAREETKFFVAFEMPGLPQQPRGSTLAVRANANPVWHDQIVTLPLRHTPPPAEGALLLRIVLCEQRSHGAGATPVALAEVMVDPRTPVVVGPIALKGENMTEALLAFTLNPQW